MTLGKKMLIHVYILITYLHFPCQYFKCIFHLYLEWKQPFQKSVSSKGMLFLTIRVDILPENLNYNFLLIEISVPLVESPVLSLSLKRCVRLTFSVLIMLPQSGPVSSTFRDTTIYIVEFLKQSVFPGLNFQTKSFQKQQNPLQS